MGRPPHRSEELHLRQWTRVLPSLLAHLSLSRAVSRPEAGAQHGDRGDCPRQVQPEHIRASGAGRDVGSRMSSGSRPPRQCCQLSDEACAEPRFPPGAKVGAGWMRRTRLSCCPSSRRGSSGWKSRSSSGSSTRSPSATRSPRPATCRACTQVTYGPGSLRARAAHLPSKVRPLRGPLAHPGPTPHLASLPRLPLLSQLAEVGTRRGSWRTCL